MQENNFEKQVQQKAGELKIQPSDELWQKVAAIITKKKTDRRIFAIILLLLLFTGSVVFFLWDNISGTKTTKAISAKINLTTTKQEKEQPDETKSQQMAGKPESSKVANKKLADKIITSTKVIPGKKNTGSLTGHLTVSFLPKKMITGSGKEQINYGKKNQEGFPHDLHNKNKFINSTKEKIKISVTSANAADLANENIPDATNRNNIIQNEVFNNPTEKKQVIDTVSNEIIADKEKIRDTQAVLIEKKEKDSAIKKQAQPNKRNKWKIGFDISLGASATQNGYLGVANSSNYASDLYSANPGQSNGNPGQVQYNAGSSKIKMGSGFVAGLFVQKDISPRVNLLTGLKYSVYSSRMKIGNRIDSISNLRPASYYYRSGNTVNYKNNFHFIELPVAVRYKLGMQTKLPVYINAGISISRLIGLHALQFDPFSGTYYKDDAPFNKTQFSVSTGLLFSLSGTSRNPFLLGPDINFGVSKMADAGFYANRHYSYFGLLLQKTMGKK